MAEAICKMAWRSLCINVGGGDDDEGTSEFLMIAQRMTAQSLTTKQYYTTQGVLLMNYLGWQCRVMGQGGDLQDGLALVIWRCWGIMMYIGGTLTLTLFLPCFLSTQGILLYCISLERERSAHVCLLVTAPSVCLSSYCGGLGTLNVGSPEKHTFPPKKC